MYYCFGIVMEGTFHPFRENLGEVVFDLNFKAHFKWRNSYYSELGKLLKYLKNNIYDLTMGQILQQQKKSRL